MTTVPALSAAAKARTRVRIVDDDPSVVRALTAFLEMDDWQVVAYGSGKAFLADPQTAPGCVVLDVRMPEMTGIEVQEEMRRRGMTLPIIFLSAHGDIELAVDAVKRGAKTFLVKPPKPGKLLAEIEAAVREDIEAKRSEEERAELLSLWNTLTAAEKEVAQLVAKGLTNSAIAEVLGVAERTVRSHKAEVYGKLDVENAVETGDFIRELGDGARGDAPAGGRP